MSQPSDRMLKIVVIVSVVGSLLSMGAVVYFSLELATYKQIALQRLEQSTHQANLNESDLQRIASLVPVQNGQDGKDGSNGLDGKNAVSTHSETILQTSVPQKGDPGPSAFELAQANGYIGTLKGWLASLNGADGQDAAPARELELQKNPITGLLEQRYSGDTVWNVIPGQQ